MAQSKYINEQGLAKIFELIAGKYETIATVKNLKDLIGAAALTEGGQTVIARLAALEADLGEDGSVAEQIAAAIDALAGSATSTDGTFVNVTVTTADGEVTAVSVEENDIASATTLKNLSDLVGTAADTKDADTVFGAIAAEAAAARKAEGDNAQAIADEKERAEGAESALSTRIGAAQVKDEGGNVTSAATGVYAYVDQQVAAVNGAADTLEETLTGLVNDEQARAEEAEGDLQDAIDEMKDASVEGSLAKQIADEVARAEEAEGDLKDAIDAEEAARKAQIGDLGKVGEGDDAADQTVKGYVDAAISAVNGDAEALEGRMDDAEDAIEALQALHAEGKTVAQEAKAAADAEEERATEAEEALANRAAALEALHAKVGGEGSDKDDFKTVAQEVAAGIAALKGDANEAFDTLVEIAEWIQSSEGNAAGFDAANRIVALETTVNTATTGLVDKVAALESKVGEGFIAMTDDEIEAAFGIVKE